MPDNVHAVDRPKPEALKIILVRFTSINYPDGRHEFMLAEDEAEELARSLLVSLASSGMGRT
jgi:hypothetical protein